MPLANQQRSSAASGHRRNVVWLASYPKSGNTWLRMFLANYFFDLKSPLPINEVHRLGIMDAAAELYRRVAPDFDPRDRAAALEMRGKVMAWVSATGSDVIFVKTHAANVTHRGTELIPPALTRAAIYVMRDPRDVVISYSRHFGITVKRAVEIAGRTDALIAANDGAVEQFTGGWSDHVRHWTAARRFPVLVLRYEDILTDPHDAFGRALAHVGVPVDPDRLARAVHHSAFSELRRQEAKVDFLEHGKRAAPFFHTGKAGQWCDGGLPGDLIDRIEREHGAVMREWGYLDD